MNKILMILRYKYIPIAITPYYYLFTFIIWQPFIWSLIKPANGVIDNKAHWFHRHAVKCLNKTRGGDSWVIMNVFGLKIRDPHAHISRIAYRWSKYHLFVIGKRKF